MIRIKNKTLCILFLFCLHSCSDNRDSEATTPVEPVAVILQPFDGIDKKTVTYVYNELRKYYPRVLINKPVSLPENAYYKPRNRYKADSLIKFLRGLTPAGHVMIGLTNKDISTKKGTVNDYGIMGLAYQPGRSCVVSTFRLSKENLLEQYFKVSIHELGHTQGLPHCPVKMCFMRDAEGKNHTNEETGFCVTCREHMIKRGWTLSL